MKKWVLTLIILMLMHIPVVLGLDYCHDVVKPNTPCLITTPIIDCSTYDLLYLSNGSLIIDDGNMSEIGSSGIYNFTFNQPSGEYKIILCENSTLAVNVDEDDEKMSLAILGFIGVLVLLFGAATVYFESELKLFFFMLTSLGVLVGVNLSAKFAEVAAMDTSIVTLLWSIYRIGLVLFMFLVFYVLIKLTLHLKARKNPPPHMGSPLQDSIHFRR